MGECKAVKTAPGCSSWSLEQLLAGLYHGVRGYRLFIWFWLRRRRFRRRRRVWWFWKRPRWRNASSFPDFPATWSFWRHLDSRPARQSFAVDQHFVNPFAQPIIIPLVRRRRHKCLLIEKNLEVCANRLIIESLTNAIPQALVAS